MEKTDFLILGAGIIGLSVARELKHQNPGASVVILEKENQVARHSSGRNSGVLHAGFYYNADSLKAKFTRDGNFALRTYCKENNLKLNECKKVVVAKTESELVSLFELEKRGKRNGVEVKIINEKELNEIEPNAFTYQFALYSPTTATVDPVEINQHLARELKNKNVDIRYDEAYQKNLGNNIILTSKGNRFEAGKVINTAGLYADKVAKDFGFSEKYTIIPFKGIYLKYSKADKPVKTNIYPVPNLKNPFLGVHYTVTVDGTVKIGPTSIPAFWRENYKGLDRLKPGELLSVLSWESRLFFTNAFGFRSLAFEEISKYNRNHFVKLAAKLVKKIDKKGFREWSKPGIRAQLLNKHTLELVQDFVVEGDKKSIHVLNAVSPAFTSSFPFAKWIVEKYVMV